MHLKKDYEVQHHGRYVPDVVPKTLNTHILRLSRFFNDIGCTQRWRVLADGSTTGNPVESNFVSETSTLTPGSTSRPAATSRPARCP